MLNSVSTRVNCNAPSVNNGSDVDNSFGRLSIPPALISFTMNVDRTSGANATLFRDSGSGICVLRIPAYSRAKVPECNRTVGVVRDIYGNVHDNRVLSTDIIGRNNTTTYVYGTTFNRGHNFAFTRGLSCRALFTTGRNGVVIRVTSNSYVNFVGNRRNANGLLNSAGTGNIFVLGNSILAISRLVRT